MEPKKTYTLKYGESDEIFTLALRVCPCDNSFVTGHERAAAEKTITTFLANPTRSIMAEEKYVNDIMNIIATVTPEKEWASWYDVDSEIVHEVITDFFLELIPKLKQLNLCLASTTSAWRVLFHIFTATMLSTPLSLQHRMEILKPLTDFTEPGADTAP